MRRIIPTLVAFALIALTLSLGSWQLRRADFKQHLFDAREVAAQGEAPLLTEVLNADGRLNTASEWSKRRAEDVTFGIRVRVAGRWLADQTVFIDNRTVKGVAGFHVITPLVVGQHVLDQDREAVPLRPSPQFVIAVNRGWIASNRKDRNLLPTVPTQVQPLTFEAWLEKPQKAMELGADRPLLAKGTPGPGDNTGLWQNFDAQRLAERVGRPVLPWVLRQSNLESAPPALADALNRDWPLPANDVAKHEGYAVQWFGLAGLTFLLWLWFTVLKPRVRPKLDASDL